jgi:hypothetical protein
MIFDSGILNTNKTRAVFTANENGLDVAYLMDPKTFKYKK